MGRKRSTPPPRMTTPEVNRLLDKRAEGLWVGVWNPLTAPKCQFDDGGIGILCPASGCRERCSAYGEEGKRLGCVAC